MLIDIVLAGAPIVVLVPVVVTLLGSHVDYTPKARAQKRLLDLLTLAESLPEGIVGSAQIARDIDRRTLRLAYVTQYPHRAREVRDIALIGIGLAPALAVYYVQLWSGAPLLYLLALLALVVITALWLDRAVVNFARNDALAYQLFTHYRAPEILVRPDTELVLKAPALTVETVFGRAADVRDSHHDGSMSTLEAVNSVLAQAHTHVAWRRELRHLAHRVRTTGYRAHVVGAYGWLLRHLLGPFFKWRLAFLDDRERHRVARAERTGEFHEIAWLTAHYRNERARLTRHSSHLHGARDPLLRWSGNGTSPGAPTPPVVPSSAAGL
jgi:hypothetical protein